MPHLLKDRTNGQEAFIVIGVPLIFGAVTGWMLGVSEIGYLILTVLGILGGLAAGLEHEYALEGFYRGMLGGLLFGLGILLTHGIIDTEAKAHLAEPEVLLIFFTAAFGAGLGALGGRIRDRRETRARAAERDQSPRFSTAEVTRGSTETTGAVRETQGSASK